MTALTIRGLAKAFAKTRVLDGIDMDVAAGTITAVVGSSGSGKTTLLRMIAGFEDPDAGTVTVAGTVVATSTGSVAPHRRSIGYVAQDGSLFPHLTVGQNIAYGLRGGFRRIESRRRVEELLELVALDGRYAGRRPDELSGGQQQRVALARALARRPALMLLDEPFSALDTGLRASTRKSVADVLAHAEVTTVLVTHDQEEALSFADQVAVLRAGRFTQIGPPELVYAAPADPYTAAFLGGYVLLPAVVAGGVADCVLGRIPVRDNGSGSRVMLRPEQLTATEVTDADGGPDVGTVADTEFRGPDVYLTIELSGQPITVRQMSVGAPGRDAKVRIEVRGTAVVFP